MCDHHPPNLPRESKNQNLKEIHGIGSEIIDATDGRRMNFDFMSSADD